MAPLNAISALAFLPILWPILWPTLPPGSLEPLSLASIDPAHRVRATLQDKKPKKTPSSKSGPTASGPTAAQKKAGQQKPAKQKEGSASPLSQDELFGPYTRNDGLLGRLSVAPYVAKLSEDAFANQILPQLTGERNRLILEVRNLVESLGDVRYGVRVASEKKLIEKGPLILPILETMKKQSDLEIELRLERVRAALEKAGTEDIEREARIAYGLSEALSYRKGPLELGALLSALASLDARVRLAALRSAGVQLRDPDFFLREPDFVKRSGNKLFERARVFVESNDLELRNAATAALGLMPLARSRDFLLEILRDSKRATSHRILALRLLAARKAKAVSPADSSLDLASLGIGLQGKNHQLLTRIAKYLAQARPEQHAAPKLMLELEDGGQLAKTTLLGLAGDQLLFKGPPASAAIGPLYIPRSNIESIASTKPKEKKPAGRLVLLESGSRLQFEKLGLDGDIVTFRALGRELRVPRSALRGILPDAGRGRALGGSRKSDQVRLRAGQGKIIEGTIIALDDESVTLQSAAPQGQPTKDRKLPWSEIEVQLFRLPDSKRSSGQIGDINQFAQVDLQDGERLVGYLLDIGKGSIQLADRIVGCVDIALSDVARIQLSNSGRAMTGFTIIADYGSTNVVELDGEGRVVWKLEDLFDPLDAELTASGTILVTEQGDDAVREYDRSHEALWEYTDLARPTDADRLANGNTLITDAGNRRVIEVSKDKKIVWTFGVKQAKRKDFKPHDADRLSNGNTLLVDLDGKRVMEVSPAGAVVWELKGLGFVADADRLPNGNTLITRRSPAEVFEVTPQGATVWKIKKLQLPGDADRLPDGTTMVAEDGGVRIYSRDGRVLRKLAAEWATEANAY